MALQLIERGQKFTKYRDDVTGRYQLQISLHDQHFQDGVGQWQSVAENLVADGLDGFAQQVSTMRHRVRFGLTGGRRWYPRRNVSGEYIEFERPQYWTGTQWQNLNLGQPAATGNAYTWDRPTFAFAARVNWHRVKLDLTLKSSAAANRIRWPVTLTGLTWNNWSLVAQSDGTVVGRVDRPTAADANGAPLGLTVSYAGGYVEIGGAGGEWASAVYPVIIDPTLTTPQDNTVADTALDSGVPDNNFGVGLVPDIMENYFGNYRNYLVKFDLSSIPGTATVDSANLSLFSNGNAGETNFTLYLNQILAANSSWIEGTKENATAGTGEPCYNWREYATVAWAGSAGARTSGTDFSSTDDGSVAITTPAPTAGQEHAFSITPSRMEAMIDANYGWRVRITSGKGETIRSSDHATQAHRPVLVVVYTLAGGAAGLPPGSRTLLGVGI